MSVTESSSPKTKAALLLILALVAGMILGIALDRVYLFRTRQLIPRRGAQFMGERMVNRLDRHLELSDQQEQQVRAIVLEHVGRIEQSWRQIEPAVRSEIAKTDAEIERVLNPEQKKKFGELRRRWRHRAERFMGPQR